MLRARGICAGALAFRQSLTRCRRIAHCLHSCFFGHTSSCVILTLGRSRRMGSGKRMYRVANSIGVYACSVSIFLSESHMFPQVPPGHRFGLFPAPIHVISRAQYPFLGPTLQAAWPRQKMRGRPVFVNISGDATYATLSWRYFLRDTAPFAGSLRVRTPCNVWT